MLDLNNAICSFNVSRTNVVIDQDFIDKTRAIVETKEYAIKTAYTEITAHAADVASSDPVYKSNPLQNLMAASALGSKEKIQLHLAVPGEGKTYAFLLLADTLLKRDHSNFVKVIIYASEPVIVSQIEEKLNIFPNYARVTVTSDFAPEEWVKIPGMVHFIFDEGEQVIKKNLVVMKPAGFAGLMLLKSKNMYFFSATCHPYWLRAFRLMFNLNKDAIFEYPSQYRVKHNRDLKPQIVVSLRVSYMEALEGVK